MNRPQPHHARPQPQAQPLSPARRPAALTRTASDRAAADQMLAVLRAGGDFRQRKVRQLKTAVQEPAYENALKIQVALDRLAADLVHVDAGVDLRFSGRGVAEDAGRAATALGDAAGKPAG